MPDLVHFEIPADDVERARKFYIDLFNWEITALEGMDYLMINTGGVISAGGGMMKRQDPTQGITNYFDIPSVDEYSNRVEELGGKVIVLKKAVPGYGYFAICLDTEGNTFGLWEENKEAE